MPSQYSNKKYVTTSDDLKRIIANCPICYKITMNAALILPIHQLPKILLPKTKQTKFFLIVHIASNRIGHWIALSVYLNDSQCIVIDPANEYKKTNEIVNYIRKFCINNKLTLIDYGTKMQTNGSNNCGQLCLAFLGKMCTSNFNTMINLRTIVKSYSVEFNEHHLTIFTQQHYNVSF